MNKLFTVCLVLTLGLVLEATAQTTQRYEAGIAAGSTHAIVGETFKNSAKNGDDQSYWLGYGFTPNWGVELGLDHFDFDRVNTQHQLISLGAVYRFVPNNWMHPIAKLAVGSVESKNFSDEKTTAVGAKLAAGLEADFKYLSVGTLFNYHYVSKAGEADTLKDAQALVPVLFLTIHNALNFEKKSSSVAPVAAVAAKDTDADGVKDEDDKCPSTPAGTVVNQYGCAEKETATIKLNVEFASGKTTLAAQYQNEIEQLAQFMNKYSDTHVEIAGYTDNKGSAAKNLILSQKRADSVKAALVKAGISPTRLIAKGYGDKSPVGDNKTEEGRAQNRRVMANIKVETDKKK